jgi:cell wall-associated NlpC family hydrolase
MTPFFKISFILTLIILLGSCASSKNNSVNYRANRNYSYKLRNKLPKHSLLRDELIINASKYAGTPYKYGGKRPSSGFDCSGFISYVYQKSGLSADGASYQQANLGSYVGFSDLKPGDLLFFGNKDKVSHVAMVYSVKNKKISVIHSTKSRGVIVENITNSRYWQNKYMFSKNLISFDEQPDLAHSNK